MSAQKKTKRKSPTKPVSYNYPNPLVEMALHNYLCKASSIISSRKIYKSKSAQKTSDNRTNEKLRDLRKDSAVEIQSIINGIADWQNTISVIPNKIGAKLKQKTIRIEWSADKGWKKDETSKKKK